MSENNFTVSIVIPNYNGRDILAKNLPLVLKAQENSQNHIIEVIIVDDASFDESVAFIKKEFPGVKLIKHTKNRGFSTAVNTGVRMAKGKLVALLNTDVIPSVNFLEKVLSHFDDNSVFAVGLHEKGYSWARAYFKDGFLGHELGAETKDSHISFWASGGSAVFRREQWMALGGMDEKLLSPFYWEDIDLSYRAQKRGLKVIWEPEAWVEHKHESTISKLSPGYVKRVRERNELLFTWKNFTSKNLTRKHITGLLLRILKHPGYIRIVIFALLRYGIMAKARKKEEKEAKICDEAIFARF